MDNIFSQITGVKMYCLLTCVSLFYGVIVILIIRHQIIDGNGIPDVINDDYQLVRDNGPGIDISELYWTTTSNTSSDVTIEGVNATTESAYKHSLTVNYSQVLVPKKQWTGGVWNPKCRTTPIKTPATTVYIAQSQTSNCGRYITCAKFVADQLRHDISLYSDIQYNFVITGQGSIFEGLAWGCKVHNDTVDADEILVLLTGDSNFAKEYVNDKQYESLLLFLGYSVATRKLASDYWLKPVCCIVPGGGNPGKRLYWHLTVNFIRFYYRCTNIIQCKHLLSNTERHVL